MITFDPAITTEDIKAIADLVGADLTIFITNATILISEILEDEGLSDNLLRKITEYTAAHFAFLKEGEVKAEKLGDSSTTFNRESGQGLASTTFGQQAIMLDTTGKLKALQDKSGDYSSGEASIEFF